MDRNHIIILERNHFFNPDDKAKSGILFGGEYDDTNIMLSLHYYEDAGPNVDPNDPDVRYSGREYLKDGIGEFLSQDEVKGYPLFVGEFGAFAARGEGYRWTKDMMEVLNQHGLHYAYMGYKNSGLVRTSRLLYQRKEPLFQGRFGVPKDKVIEHVEERLDELRTERNFQVIPELRRILEEGFRSSH